MPAETPEARTFGAGLAGLVGELGELAGQLNLEPVGLEPRSIDHQRRLSCAQVSVLVTAKAPAGPEAVIDALLALQVPAGRELRPVTDPHFWSALDRPPQVAFLVVLPAELALAQRRVSLVTHPLEAEPFDRHLHNRPDASQRP